MKKWWYPVVLCLLGTWAAAQAAPLPVSTSPSAAPVGLQPGWRFQVNRLVEREGEIWLGGMRLPAGIALKLGFVEEIGTVAAGRPVEVARTIVRLEGHEESAYQQLGVLKESVLRFQGEGFELIDRLSGETVSSQPVRSVLGWPLGPDLWPSGALRAGQAWNYQGTELVYRLGMLDVVHGRLDLRVEEVRREPRTGLDTAHIHGRLRAHIPLFGVPLLYEAAVELDLPPALGIPFRMEFNGRISGQGQIAEEDGTLETIGVDATYRVLQLVSPARSVLAALQTVPSSVSGSTAPVPAMPTPLETSRPVAPTPVPAVPAPARKHRPAPPTPAPVAKAPPVPQPRVAPGPQRRAPATMDPTVNQLNERGLTPLTMTILKDNLTETQGLIDRGADLDMLDNSGQSALLYAATVGNLEAVRLLLKNGADPDVRSPDGDTPILALAAWKDIQGEYGPLFIQATRILLDAKADVNAVNKDGNTALIYAAHRNNAKLVKLLLERGADPARTDKDGLTARRTAEIMGNKDVLPLLPLDPLDSGDGNRNHSVDARNAKGSTRLMQAAIDGELENVRDLLRRGADLNARDHMGRNPALYAAVGEEPETLRLLLEKGSDPNQPSNDGNVPLVLLATSKEFGGENAEAYLTTVEVLLSGGADADVRHKDKMTPMMYAALNGNKGMIELLLKHNADVNAKNKDGATAVVIAHTFGHTEIVKLLLDAGAEVGTGKPEQ